MAQIIGAIYTGDYHHGNPPWSEQKRAVPKRTWSGVVVYKKRKHAWTIKDVERIAKKVEVVPVEDDPDVDWLWLILQEIKKITIMMLEKIIPFLGDEEITSLYDLVYKLLGKLFDVDTSYMYRNPTEGERLIMNIAANMGYDVTLTKKRSQ